MKKVFGYILLTLEILVCAAALVIGLFDIKVDFMEDTRMVVIVLGVIGMAFCTFGVIRFIKRAPGNILSIIGYILGAAALFIFLIQLFKINVPFIGNPNWALACMAVIIILKGVIGRRGPVKKDAANPAHGG